MSVWYPTHSLSVWETQRDGEDIVRRCWVALRGLSNLILVVQIFGSPWILQLNYGRGSNQHGFFARKVLCPFARKISTTFSTTKGTKRANSKTSSIHGLLGMDRCGAPIWLSMRSTSHKILEMWCVRINLVAKNSACYPQCEEDTRGCVLVGLSKERWDSWNGVVVRSLY